MSEMGEKPNLKDVLASFNEHDKERYRQRAEEEGTYTGQAMDFFFPEKYNLMPVSVTGTVPHVGQLVYVDTWTNHEKIIDEDCLYYKNNRWRVKEIVWSMRVPGNIKERLLDKVFYRAEVHLVRKDNSLLLRALWKLGRLKFLEGQWWRKKRNKKLKINTEN
jgi:hypothetical protein